MEPEFVLDEDINVFWDDLMVEELYSYDGFMEEFADLAIDIAIEDCYD